jgi:vitamin B12 transporter
MHVYSFIKNCFTKAVQIARGCQLFIHGSTAVPAVPGCAIAPAPVQPGLPLHIRQPLGNSNTVRLTWLTKYNILLLLGMGISGLLSAQETDTSKTLGKVTVSALKYKNQYRAAVPTQLLQKSILQSLNAPTIGDAANYFSGVLVKDYGGIGGLKTVSIRSLGAAHTGIAYDGLAISDVQAGQIDMSRFSSSFVQTLLLEIGLPQQLLQPARLNASASLLSINTPFHYPAVDNAKKWQAGIHTGSFGLWQPFAGIELPVSKRTTIGVNAEAFFSKGNYPYQELNGNIVEDHKRANSDIKSLQAELNLKTIFKDSATLQVKGWGYHSERGLPGAVIFFNNRSVQRLWNKDFFVQARYNKALAAHTDLLLSGKYNYAYTRYADPAFFNNSGGLDDRYTQQEAYLSAAIQRRLLSTLSMSLASDMAYTGLTANSTVKGKPERLSLWNALSVKYGQKLWQLNGTLVWQHFNDKTQYQQAAGTTNKLTPGIAASWQWAEESPFMLRFFYKHIFRMPTFNDLYYNFIGSRNLLPELVKQYNLGISYSKSFTGFVQQLSISTDGYINNVHDKIVAMPTQNMFVWAMMNVGKVRIAGTDVNADIQGKWRDAFTWMLRLAYTWQKALDMTNRTETSYKNFLPYTPEHSGSGIFSATYKKWTAGYNLLFSGMRYSQKENHPTNELKAWGVQDIFVAKTINYKQYNVQVKAGVNNITNQAYDIVRNYPMPGRTFKVSVTVNNL